MLCTGRWLILGGFYVAESFPHIFSCFSEVGGVVQLSSDRAILSVVNLSGRLLLMTQAEMKFKDKWFACVSLGEQTFRTVTSIKLSTAVLMSCLGLSIT